MGFITTSLVYAFYGAVVVSLIYFVHKVFWFWRYWAIQDRLVRRALDDLERDAEQTLMGFNAAADASWSTLCESASAPHPVAYVQGIEERLDLLVSRLFESHRSIREAFLRAMFPDQVGHNDWPGPDIAGARTEPAGEEPTVENDASADAGHDNGRAGVVHALTVPRFNQPPISISLSLDLPRPSTPTRPPAELYELQIHSRYGFKQRLLAFFLGPVDVVYSARHVARMSQNVGIPTSVMLRRLSLVVLILGAVVIDLAFGLRARLIDMVTAWMSAHLHLAWTGAIGGFLEKELPVWTALLLWLAGYGVLYVALYLYLRSRSHRYIRRLRDLRVSAEENAAAVERHHLSELRVWAEEYGAGLDDAVLVTLHQAELLIEQTGHRARRRLASRELLSLLDRAAGELFKRLPESSRSLQDPANQHRHSWRHAIYPRAREMKYQARIAQYRAAWQAMHSAAHQLRGYRPDPELAEQTWRMLVSYARMLSAAIPSELRAELIAAHTRALDALRHPRHGAHRRARSGRARPPPHRARLRARPDLLDRPARHREPRETRRRVDGGRDGAARE